MYLGTKNNDSWIADVWVIGNVPLNKTYRLQFLHIMTKASATEFTLFDRKRMIRMFLCLHGKRRCRCRFRLKRCTTLLAAYSISQENAHGFCFAVLCCGYTLTDFPISIRLTSLALWQMNDCIATTKQSTTKPCAYFLGYTVFHRENKYGLLRSAKFHDGIKTRKRFPYCWPFVKKLHWSAVYFPHKSSIVRGFDGLFLSNLDYFFTN